MEDAILGFPEQLLYSPVIENSKEESFRNYILCGMGGSHLAAGFLKLYDPSFPLSVHYDYGLPALSESTLKESLLIASSYSGNTAETLSFAQEAFNKKLNLLIIASGGKLIELAEQNNIPFITLPVRSIQPRNALGFSLVALATALSHTELVSHLKTLSSRLQPALYRKAGEELANKFSGKIPVIYASNKNHSIAYSWKIKFNETTKVPAFFNMFPELNHNELSGFDVAPETKDLSKRFHFIFLSDITDGEHVAKRMNATKKLFEVSGLPVEVISLEGGSVLERAFNSIFLADWTALSLAKSYGVDPNTTPLVEAFKKLI